MGEGPLHPKLFTYSTIYLGSTVSRTFIFSLAHDPIIFYSFCSQMVPALRLGSFCSWPRAIGRHPTFVVTSIIYCN